MQLVRVYKRGCMLSPGSEFVHDQKLEARLNQYWWHRSNSPRSLTCLSQ